MTILKPERARRVFRSGLGLIVMGVAGLIGGIAILDMVHTDNLHLISSRSPLITRSLLTSGIYGALLVTLSLIVLGGNALYIGLKGRSGPWEMRLQKLSAALALLAVAGIIIGRPLGNQFWAKRLQQAGYTECEYGFHLTGQIFGSVWVLEPVACDDETFATLMRTPLVPRSQVIDYLCELSAGRAGVAQGPSTATASNRCSQSLSPGAWQGMRRSGIAPAMRGPHNAVQAPGERLPAGGPHSRQGFVAALRRGTTTPSGPRRAPAAVRPAESSD